MLTILLGTWVHFLATPSRLTAVLGLSGYCARLVTVGLLAVSAVIGAGAITAIIFFPGRLGSIGLTGSLVGLAVA